MPTSPLLPPRRHRVKHPRVPVLTAELIAFRRLKAAWDAEDAALDPDQQHRLFCMLLADVAGRVAFNTADCLLSPAQQEKLARFLSRADAG